MIPVKPELKRNKCCVLNSLNFGISTHYEGFSDSLDRDSLKVLLWFSVPESFTGASKKSPRVAPRGKVGWWRKSSAVVSADTA
jgi:hypothetical protein